MRLRSLVAVLAGVAALAVPPAALASYSVGTHGQIAWVRRAASNFVAAELSGNGAGACSVLNAPLQGTQHHRTCAQRWDARLAALRREPGATSQLRAEARAIGSATVIVHGDYASIELPAPLMDAASRFTWTDNCWMLTG
jgi:hypothetical protein